jgi:hypothetical protein
MEIKLCIMMLNIGKKIMSKVDFNKYYQQFFITTFRDIRVYTKEGNLFKMYKKLAANEHFESDVKIKSFIFEDN